MCGIGGFMGRFPAELLTRMNEAQASRGPDDAGVHHETLPGGEGAIGLAHRRLSILDLSSAGHQPMWNDAGSFAVVYNGEIYNFRELRADLSAAGHRFKSNSDTEVLLALYAQHGPAMLERLEGIFAFAIWDKHDNSLFVARDPLGVKPLYWSQAPEGFLFASEIKAISAWGGLDRTLDTVALEHYVTYLYCPAPRTPLLSVRKLEPGQAMIVREGRIARHWRFYDLPYSQPTLPLSEKAAMEGLREALSAAVRRQMVSDVPVGAFLSGGLDSSAIVAYAREHAMGRLQCFTIAVDAQQQAAEGQPDDLPYAEAMAAHLGVDLHVVQARSDIVGMLDKMIYHLDEPQGDPAPLNVYMISQLARGHGIKVLLSGTGGDDIFSGYRRHAALAYERYWSWMPRTARSAVASGARALSAKGPIGRRLRKATAAMDLDENERIARYFCWIDPATSANLFGRHYEVGQDPMLQALNEIPASAPALNKMLYLEGRFFLADHNLNYTDKMGMAASVEIRVPFLDRDLISFAARLPVELKQRGATGKWIFRQAMRGLLPDALIDRPKTGFGAPMRHWLRNDLREMVDAATGPGSRLESVLDLKRLRALVEADRAGRIDAAYPIFGILAMESWMRQFAQPRVLAAA